MGPSCKGDSIVEAFQGGLPVGASRSTQGGVPQSFPNNSTLPKITTYNGTATAGNGLGVVVAATIQKSETGADANVLTFAPPTTAGVYILLLAVDISIWAANGTCTASYHDSNGTSGARSIPVTNISNNSYSNIMGQTGNYFTSAPINVDNSGTNIVVATTGSVGNTYKITAILMQIG